MSCKQCNDAIRFDIFIHDLLTGILFIRPIFLYTLIWASQLLYYKQHNTTQQLLHTFSSRMLSNPFSWAWAPCECINPIYKPYIYSVQMNALNVCVRVRSYIVLYRAFFARKKKKPHVCVMIMLPLQQYERWRTAKWLSLSKSQHSACVCGYQSIHTKGKSA